MTHTSMTNERAEQAASVVLAAAAVGVAVVVLRTPALRRLAWRLAVTALTGTLPTWVANEVRHAWSESGSPQL
jgi:predicted lysophospholipase L1 biosynthesis ABC-type transport system permease subunit